jgi:hypothetical protein
MSGVAVLSSCRGPLFYLVAALGAHEVLRCDR